MVRRLKYILFLCDKINSWKIHRIMFIKIILFWLPMILIAFANAALRETVFVKHFDDLRAHQLSTITLMLFCVIYTWTIFPHLNILSSGQAMLTGAIWMLLTIIFEFGLGRLTGNSWNFLFQNYNLAEGRIWVLFLLFLLILPYLTLKIRN